MPEIHPTAIVEDGAQLADDVVVGPYCSVGAEVRIGPGCVLMHGAIVQGRTTLGAGNQVFPYAVLGSIPQDKKYEGEPSCLSIGNRNVFREHVTVHIGTASGNDQTRIGNDNLLMAGAHVGHDCVVGDHCVLANYTGLAGHVEVGDYAILGGQTGVHQFVRLGAHCITSGGSKVGKDVPPFTVAQGYPARLRGINHVGLKRRGFSDSTIRLLRQSYRAVFFDTDTPRFEDLLARVRAEFQGSREVETFLDFLAQAQSTTRGFLRPAARGEENGEEREASSGLLRREA
ncbi:MAG: acyl-ACP--UDP-N-acetylglucosamine O-acyltransferase [Planctomycetota bacterium]|nr:MAG: acyl-ACP--UDP-N-acetylglucosamine O-acyltransferase [Planctomycetota bacterium]